MVKCSKAEVRRLKTALRWKMPPEQRQRIQMVLLRESGLAQPAIAQAMGVSLSTVNRAHMAYDHGGIKALKPKPNGGRKHENMSVVKEKALLAQFAKAAGAVVTYRCPIHGDMWTSIVVNQVEAADTKIAALPS